MSLSDNKKFTDLLRRIREEKQIPQKRLAAALDIDTPMFSRIERGERLAKREQVIILAKVLELDENYLINIWMADKIYDLIKNENQPIEILEIVKNDIEVADNVSTVGEDMDATHKIVWIPPVVETEVVDEDVIVDVAEIMPEFPGGTAALMKYLGTNIKYPTISQEMGSAGRVIVQFVVDKDGSISNPEVVRGVDAYLDKEAIRVISSMPKWRPGVQNGKKVRVKYTVPVVFRLQ